MARLKITQPCKRCGKPFHPWGKRKNGKARLYCSHTCRGVPLTQRFWSQVEKTEHCWLWTGDSDKDGYGRLWRGEGLRTVRAHRLSWEMRYGPIPVGLHALHRCDNPPCVRPDHLFLGTNVDNSADRTAKGRSQRGSNHGRAIVSEELVKEIRERYARGGISQTALGREYGLAQTSVSQIVRHRCWKHV